jgi:hypothetical protein
MLDELSRERVPTLVSAGRHPGWSMTRCARLPIPTIFDSKLLLIENPTDAELAARYKGCLVYAVPVLLRMWVSADDRKSGVWQALPDLEPNVHAHRRPAGAHFRTGRPPRCLCGVPRRGCG